jgi:hypothetical protein
VSGVAHRVRSARSLGRRQAPAPATERHLIPDLSLLTDLLAASGELRALAERFATAASGRVGQDLRHVTYAAMPHGAKTYLAAALAQASGERIVWIARDAEIGDRVAEELMAWLGDPGLVVTLEPRTALAYERSELVRDESAARVAALAAWAGGRHASSWPASRRLTHGSLVGLPSAVGCDAGVSRPGRTRPRRSATSTFPRWRRGEFHRRGGIVDVFGRPPWPVRVEWFGDEVDALRLSIRRTSGAQVGRWRCSAGKFLLGQDPEVLGALNR